MTDAMKDTLNTSAPVIEARDLNLVFQTGDGPVHALKDVNLVINRGEFVSFIGPSDSSTANGQHAGLVSRPATVCRGRDGVGSDGFRGVFGLFVFGVIVLCVIFLVVFILIVFVKVVFIFVVVFVCFVGRVIVRIIACEGEKRAGKAVGRVKIDGQAKRGEHGVVKENRLWVGKGEGGQHGRSPVAMGILGWFTAPILGTLCDRDMTVQGAGGLARGMA